MVIDKLVEKEIKRAEEFANLGSVKAMEKHLKCALELFSGFEDDKDYKDLKNITRTIEKEGYLIGINVYLDKAKDYALKGDDSLMEKQLMMAGHCAYKVSIGIARDVSEIKRIGYSNALPEKIKKARIRASKGDVSNMEKMIGKILKYADYIGGEILDNALFQTEMIRVKGYHNSIDKSFYQAVKALEKGNKYYSKECILKAKEQSEKLDLFEHMNYFNKKLCEFKADSCEAQKIADMIL